MVLGIAFAPLEYTSDDVPWWMDVVFEVLVYLQQLPMCRRARAVLGHRVMERSVHSLMHGPVCGSYVAVCVRELVEPLERQSWRIRT